MGSRRRGSGPAKVAARNDACAAKFAIAKVIKRARPAAHAGLASRLRGYVPKPILGLQELQQFGFSRARFRLENRRATEPPAARTYKDRL